MSRARTYDSSGRQAAAEQRRLEVYRTAATVFAQRGWHHTTVEDVATAAGVSAGLVYRSMGGKPGLLFGALAAVVFEPAPDLHGAVVALGLEDRDGLPAKVAAVVGLADRAMPQLAPLVPVLHIAADEHPEAAALRAEMQAHRRATTLDLVALLTGAPSRPPHQLADELHLLTSAEVYVQLRGELGWTHERYLDWLQRQLLDALERFGHR